MDRLESDRRWNEDARNETSVQRLDRNWSSLLQELRVVQTGVQLLTGLLLTLPFHDGFENLRAELRMVYLATVSCSMMSRSISRGLTLTPPMISMSSARQR